MIVEQEQEKSAEYEPGELAACIVTAAKVWKPDDLKTLDPALIGTITALTKEFASTNEAARRLSVLQTWQNRHFDRAYQYLENDGRGGFSIAGSSGAGKNYLAAADDANLYPTNIFSAQGDIACGALNRGAVKVSFFPSDSKDPMQVAAAEEANSYKHLWAKYNPTLQRDISEIGWTDARAVVWTRSVRRQGKTREISTAFGVLESNLPMMVNKLDDCGYAQVFEEMDYALVRSMFPWMGDKIKPSMGSAGELEFERIARINTRIGLAGRSMMGTTGVRETTLGYTWLRPGMYFDDKVTAAHKEMLLANFPSGLFVTLAGNELACCWDESMNDHLSEGMFTRGFGQNRRSMGENDVPIQKRINIWADLWDKTVRSLIPSTLTDDQALDAEALSQQEASPQRYIPVAVPEGRPITDLMAPIPSGQLHPGFAEMFQYYIGPLVQSIDGATPALFGGGEGQDNTVGATQIRLNQSLERFGLPWMMINRVISEAAKQAVKCCSDNSKESISANVPGKGTISVNPANLKGEPDCEAETVGAIPESGAQRQAKILQLLDMANSNQKIASIVATPSNAREIVKALNIDEVITVDEADSEDLAMESIEMLLDSEPLVNPEYAQLAQQFEALNEQHEQVKTMAASATQSGVTLDPEEIEQGKAMEAEVAQLNQQMQQTPQYLPSVPVPSDESIDYSTIASTLFSWMQKSEGRQLRRKAEPEPEGGPNWKKWTNVYLYWKANKDLAAKQAADNVQPAPARVSISVPVDKMAGAAAQAALSKAGIIVAPEALSQPHEAETETIQRTPYAEIKQKVRRRL